MPTARLAGGTDWPRYHSNARSPYTNPKSFFNMSLPRPSRGGACARSEPPLQVPSKSLIDLDDRATIPISLRRLVCSAGSEIYSCCISRSECCS